MSSVNRRAHPPALQSPSPRELEELLDAALAQQHEAASGRETHPLRGRHIGLLHEAEADHEEAALLHAAASALGAQVADVQARLDETSSAQQVRHTARLLGRLYGAIDCQGLPSRLVRLVAAEAGVPVYDGLASKRHPTAPLAERLDPALPWHERRRLVLQAVLARLA